MSDENVVSFHNAEVRSERRAEFLNDMAAAYDLYIRNHDVEPECLFHVMGGVTQSCRIGWTSKGVSAEGIGSMLSNVSTIALLELQKYWHSCND